MKYKHIEKAIFLERINRFEADVLINGVKERVHVKNTGRCKEILVPECEVILARGENPKRKTRYDLVAAYRKDFGLINIDSQAPNQVVKEWLVDKSYSYVKPEFSYGESRIDFYMEKDASGVSVDKTEISTEKNQMDDCKSKVENCNSIDGGFSDDGNGIERYLMEVKGCTLEVDGMGYFPDAPTERGVKHLRELAKATEMGFHCIIAFVIQMEGISEVKPCDWIHPEFKMALEAAKAAGVEVWFLKCKVNEDELYILE